jgi:hypothetical protein
MVDGLLGSHQLAGLGVEFLQPNAGEGMRAPPVIPQHVGEPLPAILIVK